MKMIIKNKRFFLGVLGVILAILAALFNSVAIGVISGSFLSYALLTVNPDVPPPPPKDPKNEKD